ncbi:MAG: FkbM family methyltransferase [Elainella sp. Prado103]|jgi:FkbM family methyltransferase|nr:FkbM family methyltransferase [Elainella sp. Prado103]
MTTPHPLERYLQALDRLEPTFELKSNRTFNQVFNQVSSQASGQASGQALDSSPICWSNRLSQAALERLQATTQSTHWEEPETALDINNIAVMALLDAEQASEPMLRSMTIEMAIEALSQGARIGHPLCIAHLAMVHSLMGEADTAFQLAFQGLIENLQPAYQAESLPIGLVYLPANSQSQVTRSETLHQVLEAADGYHQALQIFAAVLCQIQLVFYNPSGQRFLQVALQLHPNAIGLNLKQGIANLLNQQWEGLLHLHQAQAMAPQSALLVQALYLAYRSLQPDLAAAWWQYGQTCAAAAPTSADWQWLQLPADAPFTYLKLGSLPIAVEPSLRSIVTSVLLAEGDWFEAEMELWRDQLQSGMTVIDVGANVGVYTFSAAQRVGSSGCVIAVEPFSGCVRCLEETKRLNQLDWVTIRAGAASDCQGTARLALRSASELNELVTADQPIEGEFEEVPCFPLDSLIDSIGMTQLDWLKIDAEGHEMQVLQGSERLLTEFQPAILYENIAGASASNTPVAVYLQSKGYRLFRYQPYLKNLIPVNSLEDLRQSLNVIALPADRCPSD